MILKLIVGTICYPVLHGVDNIPPCSLQDIPLAICVDLGRGMRTVATREKFIKWEVICAAVSGSGSLLCPGGAKCCIPAYGTDQATSCSSEVLIAPDLPLSPLSLYIRASWEFRSTYVGVCLL